MEEQPKIQVFFMDVDEVKVACVHNCFRTVR